MTEKGGRYLQHFRAILKFPKRLRRGSEVDLKNSYDGKNTNENMSGGHGEKTSFNEEAIKGRNYIVD